MMIIEGTENAMVDDDGMLVGERWLAENMKAVRLMC
jgi:hypothetical protein